MSTMELFKQFSFDAAHFLPHVPEGHKCKRMHGHTYIIEVLTEGPMDEYAGWVHDLGDIKIHMDPILKQLDHYTLNDIEGLENPTAENIARWIWKRLKPNLHELSALKIWETRTSGCIYRGED